MCDKIYTIDEIKSIAAPIAKRHGIAALYLFGSYARGEATATSDLDFRIEKGSLHSLLQLSSFQLELEKSFLKKIDVQTTQMLTLQFLSSIRPDEILIYSQS